MQTLKPFKYLASLGLIFILLASPAGMARAAQTKTVCTAGYIQPLINAAPEGGIVTIPAGNYCETLTISKSITLRGASMFLTTLQPAATGQRVITVNGVKDLVLENLKITGGQALTAENNVGGGVYVSNGRLTLTATWVTGNSAQYGGGVFQAGASHTLLAVDSVIEHNTAVNHGGGAYADGIVELRDSTLHENTAGWHGGGLYAQNGSVTLILGSVDSNHTTNGDGGGVGANNNLSIFGTEFTANTAGGSGGGVSQWNNGRSVSITSAHFSGNSANVNGGGAVTVGSGVFDPTSTITVSGSEFIANTAKSKGGGLYAGSYFTISKSTFTANTVDSASSSNTAGGGLYANDGINGSELTFTGNKAKCSGCPMIEGGGLTIHYTGTATSQISSSTFDGNVAWSGGGLSSNTGVQLTIKTSKFINHGATCSFPVDCVGYGGGIDASSFTGDQLLFQNNFAVNNGGGISANSATLTNSRFFNNSSQGNGSGVRANSINGTNLLMIGNTSSNGGAIQVEAQASSLQYVTISNLTQKTGSGIYIASTATLTLKNSIISTYTTGINKVGALVEDYNLFYNNSTHISGSSPAIHSLIANPLFVNPAGGDYHLQSTSPAIAHGTNLGVPRDLDGKPRVGHWDIGAYQYWVGLYLPTIRK